MSWWANPLNPPTRGGLSQVTKFLAHHKVSQIGFTHFQPGSWWAKPCEPAWLTLTYLSKRLSSKYIMKNKIYLRLNYSFGPCICQVVSNWSFSSFCINLVIIFFKWFNLVIVINFDQTMLKLMSRVNLWFFNFFYTFHFTIVSRVKMIQFGPYICF